VIDDATLNKGLDIVEAAFAAVASTSKQVPALTAASV
jgi:hypothetical protein